MAEKSDEEYRSLALRLYVAYGKAATAVYNSIQQNTSQIPEGKSYGRAFAGMFPIISHEALACLNKIVNCDDHDIINCQKPLYYQARLCMEGVADLSYISSHPKGVKQFFGGQKDYSLAIELYNTRENTPENSKEVADLMRKVGRLGVDTTERIEKAFPDLQPMYAMLCYHTHPNFMGILIEVQESAASDTIHNLTESFAYSLTKLLDLVSQCHFIDQFDELLSAVYEVATEITKRG